MTGPVRRKVAIIGAGVGGLLSIKSCLEEGLEPVCFEQLDKIGGVWNFTEKYFPGQGGCVYESLRTNVSKEIMCISDFPMSAETNAFPTHREVFQYLEDYARHFDLIKHIQFCTTVISVKKSNDYQVTGNWDVTYLHRQPDARLLEEFEASAADLRVETFNAVMACNGRHALPNQPHVSGEDTFKGVFLHSIKYRSANTTEFRDQRVLVVGNAHSAGDVAMASSNYASKTTISIGKGTWIITKYQPNGLPFDLALRRVFLWLPEALVGFIMKKQANSSIDHAKYNIAPPGGPLHSTIMVNDNIASAIKDGRILVKPTLIGFHGNVAMFNDGTEEDVDTVVMATGFQYDYSFLDIEADEDGMQSILYRQVWPGTLPHASAALIGCLSTRGAAIPSIELQARWAARVFAGHARLPDGETMLKEARDRTSFMRAWFGRDRLIPAPNGIIYQDKLAEEIGAKPSFFKLLFKMPYLAFLCYFGPAFAVQYRLIGPHPWHGAPAATKAANANTVKGCPQYLESKGERTVTWKTIAAFGLGGIAAWLAFVVWLS
ncbi:dimethylaniline monooxygenase [N-oxide-forming] 2-like [Lineus longissimus]|uniref:dimethylaniline monooxygenase [N-oxide-forming] 2-like n=1 Tax=Lineus longissimus TaxID=88925 RepID=UPI002B4E314B